MESDAFVHLDKTVFNKYEDVTCLRVPLHQLQELSKALRKWVCCYYCCSCWHSFWKRFCSLTFAMALLGIPRKDHEGESQCVGRC